MPGETPQIGYDIHVDGVVVLLQALRGPVTVGAAAAMAVELTSGGHSGN